jgi:tetratricopeptide (TPR) repeat protein
MRYWRVISSVAVLAAALAACTPADPAVRAEQQWRACERGAPSPERAHACSEVISAAETPPERRAQALLQRGAQRAAQRQYGRAVADFGRALRIDPNLARAYAERGSVHYQRGAFDRAVADYDAALALQPGLRDVAMQREAALHGRENEAANQLATLTRMITEDPRNAVLWNNRCWIRAVAGDELEFALSDCNESIRLQPRNAEALDSRGLVHIKRGEFAAAVADYNAALAIEPGRGHYLYGRGIARIRMGQKDEGEADLTAAEQAEPGVRQLYRTYGVEA